MHRGSAPPPPQAKAPDARVINLETAVTTHAAPWPHKGINYRMHPGAARGLGWWNYMSLGPGHHCSARLPAATCRQRAHADGSAR